MSVNQIITARCETCDWRGLIRIDKRGSELDVEAAKLHCPGCGSTTFLKYQPRHASAGAVRIANERARQVEVLGFDHGHDDTDHKFGELAAAAREYAQYAAVQAGVGWLGGPSIASAVPDAWPWAPERWKPHADVVRNLDKAGALIAAEIDRLLRARPEQEQEAGVAVAPPETDDERREWIEQEAARRVESTLCVRPVVPWCRACGKNWLKDIVCCETRRDFLQLCKLEVWLNASPDNAESYAKTLRRAAERAEAGDGEHDPDASLADSLP